MLVAIFRFGPQSDLTVEPHFRADARGRFSPCLPPTVGGCWTRVSPVRGQELPRFGAGPGRSLERVTALVEDPEAERGRDRLSPGPGIQPLAGLAHVGANRLGADGEPTPDLLVREPVGDVREHLCFARRELRLARRRSERDAREGGIDVAPPGADRLERLSEIGERRVLQDQRVCAGLEDDADELWSESAV